MKLVHFMISAGSLLTTLTMAHARLQEPPKLATSCYHQVYNQDFSTAYCFTGGEGYNRSGEVLEIELRSQAILRTFNVTNAFYGNTLSLQGNKLYVVENHSFYNPKTHEYQYYLTQIDLPSGIVETKYLSTKDTVQKEVVAIGDTLYGKGTSNSTILSFDLKTNTVTREYELPPQGYFSTLSFQLSLAGNDLYILDTALERVIKLDLTSGKIKQSEILDQPNNEWVSCFLPMDGDLLPIVIGSGSFQIRNFSIAYFDVVKNKVVSTTPIPKSYCWNDPQSK